MRLKNFKDFIYRTNIEDILQSVEDIFDHLRDFDFEIEVGEYSLQNESSEYPDGYIEEEISFTITKSDKSSFIIEGVSEESIELKDCVLRSKDIMSDWRLQMEIRFIEDNDATNYTGISSARLKSKDVNLDGEIFINHSPIKKVDYPILVFRVYFTRRLSVLTKRSRN